MSKKYQTPIGHWITSDNEKRYLINVCDLQLKQKQKWTKLIGCSPQNLNKPINSNPVIVSELLEIPQPLPEISWLNGNAIAMVVELPEGTLFKNYATGTTLRANPNGYKLSRPVIVTQWPDGSKPVKENSD